MTALHWGCSKGHLDAVKLLIEFHAFPNHMEFTEDRYVIQQFSGECHRKYNYIKLTVSSLIDKTCLGKVLVSRNSFYYPVETSNIYMFVSRTSLVEHSKTKFI